MIKVTDYGADPTGAANSSTQIQNAITAAGGKDVVEFDAGTYRVDSPLQCGDGTHLFAYARGSVKLTGAANPLVQVNNVNGPPDLAFTLENFVFQPSGGNTSLRLESTTFAPAQPGGSLVRGCSFIGQSTTNIGMVVLTYAANCFFSDCVFTGSTQTPTNFCVYLTAASPFFENCAFQAAYTAVSMNPDSSHNPSQSVYFVNCNISACKTGIASHGTYNWSFVNSNIGNGETGIYIDGDSDVSIIGAFLNGSGKCIWINNTGAPSSNPANGSNGIYIVGNYLNLSDTFFGSPAGIDSLLTVSGTPSSPGNQGTTPFGIVVRDNYLSTAGVSPQPVHAMSFSWCGGVTVDDNFLAVAPSGAMIATSNIVPTATGYLYQNLIFAIRNNHGVNPAGTIPTPIALTSLGSGNYYTNVTNYDCTVYIAGGAVTGVHLAPPGGTASAIPVSSGSFRVPAGGRIAVDFTGSPTWYWVAD